MRKAVHSATLEIETIALLGEIAAREYRGNRSAALRSIITDAARSRGLTVQRAPVTPDRRPVLTA